MSSKISKRWYNEKYKEIFEKYDGKYEDLVDLYVYLLWEWEEIMGEK